MNDNELAQTVEKFQAHQSLNDDETTALLELHDDLIHLLLMFDDLYGSTLEQLNVDVDRLQEVPRGVGTAETVDASPEGTHVSKRIQ